MVALESIKLTRYDESFSWEKETRILFVPDNERQIGDQQMQQG